MSFSEDRSKEHLKQIIASQGKDRDRPLNRSELKELTEQMNVSCSKWEELMAKADLSLETVVKHLNLEGYTQTIVSAGQFAALNPYSKDGNAILAQSHCKRRIEDKGKYANKHSNTVGIALGEIMNDFAQFRLI